MGENAREIFKATQHFSQKDRDEAIFERRKNLHLMDFPNAHGISINDVQAFFTEGKMTSIGITRHVFDKSPEDIVPLSAPLLLRGQQIPTSYFGVPSKGVL